MGVLNALEIEFKRQIEFSRATEESEVDAEYNQTPEWNEGYYEGFRAGVQFALDRISFHKKQNHKEV